jgi:SAM-dependent methyltransferase
MTTTPLKPAWTGDDWLSRLVNVLINTKPLYALMKRQARQVLIKTAEKNGIPWRQQRAEWEASDVRDRLPEVIDATISYPDYYRVPFHAYPEGNLCWQAAFEAEAATYSMALRVWPQESLTWQAAQDRLRGSFHQVLADHGPKTVQNVLDIGCSVGISTLYLHQFYQARQEQPVRTVGLDLSPHMLTVAAERDRDRAVEWVHGRAEATGFPSASFDVVTLQFVAPRAAPHRHPGHLPRGAATPAPRWCDRHYRQQPSIDGDSKSAPGSLHLDEKY